MSTTKILRTDQSGNSSSSHFTSKEIWAYYEQRVPKLKRRGPQWRGPCPIHQGERDSFSVKAATGEWFCFSKCARGGSIFGLEMELGRCGFQDAIVAVERLVGSSRNGHRNSNHRMVAIYPYYDQYGKLIYETVRFEPKDFQQRRPNEKGGYVWNLKGVERLPYRLPEVLKAQLILIVEGEKDCHSGHSLGFVATTNSEGAGKWQDRFREYFSGKDVVIIPDIDPDPRQRNAGYRHALQIARSLVETARTLKVIEFADAKDLSEWAEKGHTAGELSSLIESAKTLDTAAVDALERRWLQLERFRVDDSGVYSEDPESTRKPLLICGRLDVVASTRDDKGEAWGRLLQWRDREGNTHRWSMPMNMLAGSGDEYRSRLLDGGLHIEPGKASREQLTTYIQRANPPRLVRCVSRVGWYGGAFVLPDSSIGPGAEEILFQSPLQAEHRLNVAGSVDDWRSNVGEICSGNCRIVFSVSCAFAATLLSLADTESGGFHLWGPSSTGKTTILIAAGSVWGGGGRAGYVESWRATANGLEAFAELHNDGLGCLDEISQVDAHEAVECLYMLANGQGKGRMTKTMGARRRLCWTVLVLSSGELTLAEHVESVGKRTKGGTEIRLANILADAGAGMGVIEDLHGFPSSQSLTDHLKEKSRKYYGSPIRAFVKYVAHNRAGVSAMLRDTKARFLAEFAPANCSGEVSRVATRFAIVATAGMFATSLDITGWADGEAYGAAGRCFRAWLEGRGTETRSVDEEAGVARVRQFIENHGASRFQSAQPRLDGAGQQIPERVTNRVGFRVDGDGRESTYLVLPESFQRELCAGFDYKRVAKTLAERNQLITEPGKHLTIRRTLPEVGKTRVYAIRATILRGEQ